MDVIRMPTQKRLAMKIKRLRAAREMTQAVLAKKAGLTQVHIARLESGKHDPTLGTLQKLAKALKVTVGELVE
jgi:transcriptional regulator with XRE-family HTH domain